MNKESDQKKTSENAQKEDHQNKISHVASQDYAKIDKVRDPNGFLV